MAAELISLLTLVFRLEILLYRVSSYLNVKVGLLEARTSHGR